MRIFLRLNLVLGFNSFSLRHHAFNCKGVLGGISINFTLCLLFHLLFWPRDPHITLFLFGTPADISIPCEGSWVVRGCSGGGRGRAARGGKTVGSSLISSG